MSNNPQPELPNNQWAITKEDKEKIVAMGRELNTFVLAYAARNAENGKFHTKIVAGAFEYFFGLQQQKAKLIGDDVLIAQDAMEKHGLGIIMVEPFVAEDEKDEAPVEDTNVVTDENGAISGVIPPSVVADETVDEQLNTEVADASVSPSDLSVDPSFDSSQA